MIHLLRTLDWQQWALIAMGFVGLGMVIRDGAFFALAEERGISANSWAAWADEYERREARKHPCTAQEPKAGRKG